MAENKNLAVFKQLGGTNVSEWTETKNTGSANLTYLSWAKAWDLLKQSCPDATYEIVKNENHLPYFADDLGIMVYTRITINDLTYEMWLSVMDGANNALKTTPYTIQRKGKDGKPYDKVVPAATMNDINKTVMRCLTKNMAMFGLGLHVYQGEDIPLVEQENIKEEQKQTNIALVCQYAEMAADSNQLQLLWDSNPTYQRENDFKQAMLKKVETFIESASTVKELVNIYNTSQWAQPLGEFTDMCTARKKLLNSNEKAA